MDLYFAEHTVMGLRTGTASNVVTGTFVHAPDVGAEGEFLFFAERTVVRFVTGTAEEGVAGTLVVTTGKDAGVLSFFAEFASETILASATSSGIAFTSTTASDGLLGTEMLDFTAVVSSETSFAFTTIHRVASTVTGTRGFCVETFGSSGLAVVTGERFHTSTAIDLVAFASETTTCHLRLVITVSSTFAAVVTGEGSFAFDTAVKLVALAVAGTGVLAFGTVGQEVQVDFVTQVADEGSFAGTAGGSITSSVAAARFFLQGAGVEFGRAGRSAPTFPTIATTVIFYVTIDTAKFTDTGYGEVIGVIGERLVEILDVEPGHGEGDTGVESPAFGELRELFGFGVQRVEEDEVP